MASNFPEFDLIVAQAVAVGAILKITRSASFCSAIMDAGDFRSYCLVASSRINGEGPEICDPNEKMMERLGLKP